MSSCCTSVFPSLCVSLSSPHVNEHEHYLKIFKEYVEYFTHSKEYTKEFNPGDYSSHLLVYIWSFVFAVSRAIQTINEAVNVGDPVQTLAALRNPGAGLYGVTSECAQTYQDDLVKVKNQKNAEGEDKTCDISHLSSLC